MTAAEFIAVRGEFATVYANDPARISAALAAAEIQTDADSFGASRTEAVMWLAAHILAADPLGRDARIIGKKAIPIEAGTLYLQERERLAALYACGMGLAIPGCDTEE